MSSTEVIIHDEKDNVGVVVIEKIKPNQECNCWIMENDKSAKIQSISEIPLGHKIAMTDLKEGDTILKYGHDIGKVVKEIKEGKWLFSGGGFGHGVGMSQSGAIELAKNGWTSKQILSHYYPKTKYGFLP